MMPLQELMQNDAIKKDAKAHAKNDRGGGRKGAPGAGGTNAG